MIAATPALERLSGRRVAVVGAGREAAYVEDGGFVAVLTTTRPLLPNGMQVERLPAVGDEVVIRGEPWDPTLRVPDDPRETLEALRSETGAADRGDTAAADRDEIVALRRAVEARDPAGAAAAGERLIGRGPGLTPEGDDLVAGVAGVLAARDEAFVAALIGADLRTRTTSLSATLLELAAGGMGPEPLQALLAGEHRALQRLLGLGHSTGRAYALGAGLALPAAE